MSFSKKKKYTPSKHRSQKHNSRTRNSQTRNSQTHSRRNTYSIKTERDIIIPKWAKIVNYRTMDNEKKDLAVAGYEKFQIEWMLEEVNEFYEAIQLQDIDEIRDEAIGLIRTSQQFSNSKSVISLWKKVRNDVFIVFRSQKIFMDTFAKWHAKKLKKNQARDVLPQHLIDFAGLKW
jgi:hypothetical protein